MRVISRDRERESSEKLAVNGERGKICKSQNAEINSFKDVELDLALSAVRQAQYHMPRVVRQARTLSKYSPTAPAKLDHRDAIRATTLILAMIQEKKMLSCDSPLHRWQDEATKHTEEAIVNSKLHFCAR